MSHFDRPSVDGKPSSDQDRVAEEYAEIGVLPRGLGQAALNFVKAEGDVHELLGLLATGKVDRDLFTQIKNVRRELAGLEGTDFASVHGALQELERKVANSLGYPESTAPYRPVTAGTGWSLDPDADALLIESIRDLGVKATVLSNRLSRS